MEASKLKEILEQHKLWVDGKGGKRALLESANLKDANLTGADLRSANLCDANLTGANLESANLESANLEGANLGGADLEGADLRHACLRGANLEGASLTKANLTGANLTGANLTGANLTGPYLFRANLSNAILPDISWIIPGCLIQLNQIKYGFYLEKERKWENFVQDSFGFIVQNNVEEKTFDMFVEDRVIRNIPDWVKYSGLKQIASESV